MSIDDIYQQVVEDFKITGSVKKSALNVGTTLVRAQRILITEGLWSSPTSEKVVDLYSQGKSVKEIAAELFLSEKTVQAYLPYTRTGKGYGGDNRSTDAKKSDDYRKRMHITALAQVSEKDMEKERGLMKKVDSGASQEKKPGKTGKEINQSSRSNLTIDELYKSHMEKTPQVLKLKLSLDMEYLDDEDMEILRKYGKVEKGITREILVPADITLHALNYVILRAFGWRNSHLHCFKLPTDVFQKLTGGKNKTDKYEMVEFDGKFLDWVKLCGIYFRFPCEDFADLYWDDDYQDGQSIKTWFRKKYTGPYMYKGNWENYHNANDAAVNVVTQNPKIRKTKSFKEWNKLKKEGKDPHSIPDTIIPIEKASIMDFCFSFAGNMDELLERIPLIELLRPVGIKEDESMLNQIKFLQKRQEKEKEHLPVVSVTDELNYEYDSGDGWKVKIQLEDCYYLKKRIDEKVKGSVRGSIGKTIPDEQRLSEMTAYDMNNTEQGKAMTLKIATVATKHSPIGLTVDGLSVMDDVGGIHGYVELLRTIHGEDPIEEADAREWAKWMGWNGRMTAPENLR